MRVSQESTSVVTHWVMVIWFFSYIYGFALIFSLRYVSVVTHWWTTRLVMETKYLFVYIYKYTHKIKKELRQVQFNLSPIFGPHIFLGDLFLSHWDSKLYFDNTLKNALNVNDYNSRKCDIGLGRKQIKSTCCYLGVYHTYRSVEISYLRRERRGMKEQKKKEKEEEEEEETAITALLVLRETLLTVGWTYHCQK